MLACDAGKKGTLAAEKELGEKVERGFLLPYKRKGGKGSDIILQTGSHLRG